MLGMHGFTPPDVSAQPFTNNILLFFPPDLQQMVLMHTDAAATEFEVLRSDFAENILCLHSAFRCVKHAVGIAVKL